MKKQKIKNKNNKISLNNSLYKNNKTSNNFKNTYKDSLEETNSFNSNSNIFIPDSLNESKNSTIIGDKTPKKIISNKINILNIIKKDSKKDYNNNKNNMENLNEEKTKKIDYRYYTNYPVKMISRNTKNEKTKKYYWLAVYDKLMKKSKIMNILNYYGKRYKESDVKEKVFMIKDFDIFFVPDTNKSYIKYSKDGYIFVKLYLLSIEQINLIITYINRLKYHIKDNLFNSLIKKGAFKVIDNNISNLKYNILYCLGIYMNTYIYSFSYLPKNNENENNKVSNSNYKYENNNYIHINEINQKYPDSKKIAKLIKLLSDHFPKYSIDFFICYLLSKIKFQNFNKKSNEIKNILYFKKKSLYQINFLKLNDTYIHKSKTNNLVKEDSLSNTHYTSTNKQINRRKITFHNTIEKMLNNSYNNIINKSIKTKLDISKNNIDEFDNKKNLKINIFNNFFIKNNNKINKKLVNIEFNKSSLRINKISTFEKGKIPINNKYKKLNKNNEKKYNKTVEKNNSIFKKPKKELLKEKLTMEYSLNNLKPKGINNKGIFVVKRTMTNSENFEDSMCEENDYLKNENAIKINMDKKIYSTPPKKKKI